MRVGRGLVEGALRTAESIDAEAIQVFAGNPRGWAHSTGAPGRDAAFREETAARAMPVFVHAPYLINLGSPTQRTYRQSVDSVAHNLRRATEIGAQGVVVHTGSCVDQGDDSTVERALRQVREGLLPVLDTLDDHSPWLLLEPTAGQGRSLCAGVEDLGPYLDALDRHPRVGICLDTCHVFAAGARLDEPGGVVETLALLEEVAGPGRLRLVHANDSMDVRGSRKDRHARIGEGHIGAGAFADLLRHPATAGVPFILETPGSGEPGGPCLPLLRKLRDEG